MKPEIKRNLISKSAFALGAVGKDLISNYVGLFYLFFLTAAVGLSPLILGFAFFFAKIWDGVNDPIVGTLVDNTRTRFGKYRPWLVFGSLLNGAVMILMFLDVGNTLAAKYIYYIALYVLWDMTFTMMDIPYWAMIPSLADNERERNNISTIARIFTGVGTLIVVLVTPFFLEKYYNSFSKEGYLAASAIFTTAYVLMMCIMAALIRENYTVPSEKIAAKEIFPTLAKNDQLRSILFFGTLNFAAMAITSIISPYYFSYVMGDFTLISLFSVILGAGYGGAMLLFPYLSKKFGRRKVFFFSGLLSIAGYVLLFLFSSFLPGSRVAFSAAALLTFSGFGIIAVSITAMLADVVDYGEYITGKRTESLVFAMQSFTYKFASALATLVTGIGLQIAGLTGRDPETEIEVTLSAMGEATIRVVMFIVPIALLVAALILYIKLYKLNGDYKDRIMRELKERRNLQSPTSDSISENGSNSDLRPLSIRILDYLDKKINGVRRENLPTGIIAEYDLRYGDNTFQTADAFFPSEKPLGTIINVHGGGFMSGDKRGLREFCGKLASYGYFVLSINYPLAPHARHPEQVRSVLTALDYLASREDSLALDLANVYLTGDSAGAYLCMYAAAALNVEELRQKYGFSCRLTAENIKGLMLYCGIYDFEKARNSFPKIVFRDMIRGYFGISSSELVKHSDKRFFSPANFITAAFPPAFIAFARYDPLKSQSERVLHGFAANGVSATAYYAKRRFSSHDFQLDLTSEDSRECLSATEAFLHRNRD